MSSSQFCNPFRWLINRKMDVNFSDSFPYTFLKNSLKCQVRLKACGAMFMVFNGHQGQGGSFRLFLDYFKACTSMFGVQ